MYLVYKHTSPSGKSYIGITKNYNRRCQAHKDPNSRCSAFKSAIKKYGWDNFTHEILVEGITLEEANTLEVQLILEHNTLSPGGYNLTTGGGNSSPSVETRAKLSVIGKSRMTEEARILLSEKKMGVLKGRPITEEARQKRIGRVPSESARKSMSDAAKRRHAIKHSTTDQLGDLPVTR